MQSAVVLVVTEAQPLLEQVWAETGAPRLGMPAHVTLLYPFVDDPDAGVVEELRFFFAGVDGFPLAFSRTEEFPEVVYLAPDQADECVALTEALVRRWPGCAPYSGEFDRVVPHLTVVRSPDAELRDRVRTSVEQRLPVQAAATAASLWVRQGEPPHERWECLAELPMAPVEP